MSCLWILAGPHRQTALAGVRSLLGASIVGSCAALAGAGDTYGLQYIEPDAANGQSLAVVVDGRELAHTTQLGPLDATGALVGKDDINQQITQMFDNLRRALAAAGSGFDRLIKLNVYVADDAVADAVRRGLAREFSGGEKPAVSMVETSMKHGSVAMDAIGATAPPGPPRAGLPVARLMGGGLFAANERLAHVAVLPAGPRVYISGQAEPGDLLKATRATLESLSKTLTYLGLDLGHVVSLKAFVTPADQIIQAEEEVIRFFGDQVVPPISWVEWQSSSPIEIELVAAALPRNGTAAIEYLTPSGMTASPVFCRVTRIFADRTIYVSGLYGEPGGEGAEQVRGIFATLDRAVRACGSDLKHLAKATYYVADDDASNQLNKLRPEYYDPQRPPAASKALVRGVGRAGKTITLDMIAVPVGKE